MARMDVNIVCKKKWWFTPALYIIAIPVHFEIMKKEKAISWLIENAIDIYLIPIDE